MNPATMIALMELAKSDDPGKLLVCLQTLAGETQTDPNVCSVVSTAISGLGNVKVEPDPVTAKSIREALTAVLSLIGQSEFLRRVADSDPKPAKHLALILPAVGQPLSATDLASLRSIAQWSDIPYDVALWFVGLVQKFHPTEIELLFPLASHLGHQVTAAASTGDSVQPGASVELPHETFGAVAAFLAHDTADAPRRTAGLIQILAMDRDPLHAGVIGPFVESIGAWDRFAQALLTKERVLGMIQRASDTGLARSLAIHLNEPGKPVDQIAQDVANDRALQRSVARLVSSRGTFMALCRFLADPRIRQLMMGLVSDSSHPCRLAAVRALGVLGNEEAAAFLKTGLVDDKKDVREASAESLKTILGEEGLRKCLEDTHAENAATSGALKDFAKWAQEALGDIGGGLKSAAEAVQRGASHVSDWVRSLFDREA